MRTNDPDIYAGGDCVVVPNLITGQPAYLPMGSMANRQGRVIGTNLAGGDSTFDGVVGSWCVKLYKMSACGTGLTLRQAIQAGFDAAGVPMEQLDKAHFYPEKSMMTIEVVVDKPSRRVLGVQGFCSDGIALKARIDAVAAMLQFSRPTLNDLSNLEVAYAPPFAAAMDVINTAANVADNVLSGLHKSILPMNSSNCGSTAGKTAVLSLTCAPARGPCRWPKSIPENGWPFLWKSFRPASMRFRVTGRWR